MKKLAPLWVLFPALMLVHCSGTQSVDCPPGLQLNVEGTACECPPGQVLLDAMCVDEGLCAGVSCDDGNPCTVDGACSPDTGECPTKTFASIETACDLDSGAGRCMDGACTEIPAVCIGVVCNDENDCTKNVCQDNAGTAVCVYPNEDDTTACDAGGNPGFCDGDGGCEGLCPAVGCEDDDECTVDGDCDPATGRCPAKTPLDCDDGDACTADTCDAQVGCVSAFIDNDRDGYAPFECSAESPHQGGDCHDDLAERNPGQTMFFSTTTCESPETPPCIGDETWDYDCDGIDTPRNATFATGCSGAGKACALGSGWRGTVVPACGASASYQSCLPLTLGCTASNTTRHQDCR